MLSVCLWIPPINFRMPEPNFMKLGMYIMVSEPNSTAYKSLPSVCVCVYPLIISRQRLGKKFAAATNTHATKEEFLEASFSMRSLSYHEKLSD
jgi:hypothetical protein